MQISELTRRNVIDLLLLQERPFHGKVGLISFLNRIWVLSAMPSTDYRFNTAEGDINQHMVFNEDWDHDFLLQDYLDLPRGEQTTFTRFLETYFHPAVVRPDEDLTALVGEVNAFLHLDGFELWKKGEIAGRPHYQVQVVDPMAAAYEDHVMTQQVESSGSSPPFDSSAFAETLIEVFMARGAAREVAILTFAVECSFSDWTYSSLDAGSYGWTLSVRLPARLYGQFPGDEINASERLIVEAGRELFKDLPSDWLDAVKISPSVHASPQIREEALHWLNGAGINNQGRVRTDNIAARQVDGLLFRSQPEIHLYRALKRTGVTMAPLPVFLRGGQTYARFEPDFVLWKDKVLLIVEVDGDTVHNESPAEAQERLRPLEDEGASIRRIPASACNTEAKARACANDLLETIERLKRQR